jgi:hypothetical protein
MAIGGIHAGIARINANASNTKMKRKTKRSKS